MKKTITTAVFCVIIAGAAQAQTSELEARGIYITPKSLTSDNKPVLVSLDYDQEGNNTVNIYDEHQNVAKTINLNLKEQTYSTWTETATIMPTDAKISRTDMNLDYNDGRINTSYIMTATDLAKALNQYYDLPADTSAYEGFTDIDGNISCCRYNNHYLLQFFGDKYPANYISLIDGHLYYVRRTYEPVFDEDATVWTKLETSYESVKINQFEDFDYYDYDNNCFSGSILCTQTLFNEDDSWEFLVPNIEITTRYNYNYGQIDENGITVTRRCEQSTTNAGMKVIKEDGSEIPGLSFANASYSPIFLKISGSTWFKSEWSDASYRYHTSLYALEDNGTSVKSVREVSSRKLAQVRDNGIDVNVDEQQGLVLLTNMSGSMVDRKTVNGETMIRLNTHHLPKGVYNVTLQREGRTIANEKVFLP